MQYEQQYLSLCQRILEQGEWVANERTGKRCLTVINADFTIKPNDAPLITTKKSFPVSATAELLGYLRGYTNAADFADIGSNTWFKNANETEEWLNNPHRKGEHDLGRIYGAIGRDFGGIDLLRKVYDNLSKGIDDRGETITFWKPDEFHLGALRPCMHTHTFSLLGETLHLTSYQRSCDVPLGLNFNSIQCYVFLKLMAKITGHKMGNVYHKIVNAHIYEDQIDGVKEMLSRKPLPWSGTIEVADWVNTLDDVVEQDSHARSYIDVKSYYHQGKIEFNMTA